MRDQLGIERPCYLEETDKNCLHHVLDTEYYLNRIERPGDCHHIVVDALLAILDEFASSSRRYLLYSVNFERGRWFARIYAPGPDRFYPVLRIRRVRG